MAVPTPVKLEATSKILCTLQSAGGVLQSVTRDLANNTFTIHLVDDATEEVLAAWFVLS